MPRSDICLQLKVGFTIRLECAYLSPLVVKIPKPISSLTSSDLLRPIPQDSELVAKIDFAFRRSVV
jgi:hypothetical protein